MPKLIPVLPQHPSLRAQQIVQTLERAQPLAKSHPQLSIQGATFFHPCVEKVAKWVNGRDRGKGSQTVPLETGGVVVRPSDVPLEEQDNNPLVIYLHGGAYVTGTPFTHLPLARSLSRYTRGPVCVVDYRLCPGTPFPTPLEDAAVAYKYVLENFPNKDIFLAGESAGGHLTVASTLNFQKKNLPPPRGVVCLSGWLDWEGREEGRYEEGIKRDGITQEGVNSALVELIAKPFLHQKMYENIEQKLPNVDLDLFRPECGYGALSLSSFLSNIEKPTPSPLSPSPSEAYSSLSPFTLSHPYFFPSSSSSSSSPPLISPILSLAQISPSHLSSFPPTLLQTTSSELLLSDSLLFEQKLREAGRGKELHIEVYKDLFHAWQICADFLDDAQSALKRIADFCVFYSKK